MKPGMRDAAGEAARAQLAEDLSIKAASVRVIDVYTIHAKLSHDELIRLRDELFTDSVIQDGSIDEPLALRLNGQLTEPVVIAEVGFRPGVTDNVGRSAREGIQDTLGRALGPDEAVFKSTQYIFCGLDEATVEHAVGNLLANGLIERWAIQPREAVTQIPAEGWLGLPIVTERSEATVQHIDLEISDDALMAISRDGMLALELAEMQAIRDHYRDPAMRAAREERGLPPCPTDIELEVYAQTWSEHCKHKIFAALVEYTDEHGNTQTIDGLFKSFVKATTDKVAEKVDWLVSVFHDNAGLIRFDDDHLFALKAETHNSPSALDPYGGAMTGIVGVNRDILGAGMGCRPIFNTDVFCFASPFFDGEIPPRLMHPRRVLRGVHRGVKDGGNESGIPTINGAIVFHERFLGKPLVFCGTGGLIPTTVAGKPSHEKEARPGDLIVMCGGRIGKDGIHGATFSSEELHEGSPATAVQIGDPITQKKMVDFILEARDLGLFSCITDNGAGGLSSSIGEMAQGPGGAELHLDRAPLKYAGLAPWEIFLSEAQERMSLAVPPESEAAFLALAAKREVEATTLGSFTDSGRLDCYYDGALICAIDMEFLHEGVPRMHLEAQWEAPLEDDGPVIEIVSEDWADSLKAVLAAPNVCSKEAFVRMYDHEVLAQSVLKPFQGAADDGPGNAGVIRPVPGSKKGIAVACGICPKYSDFDTYDMMACAIDEAVRNLVAVGGKLGTIAGLDNFCWPDPVQSEKTPDGSYKMAQLVRCCQALYDICVAYDIPLISGKDSMKNDYRIGDTKISIPPTVLFTAAAVLDDVTKCVSMDAKEPGDLVYLIGTTKEELGGSEFYSVIGSHGGTAPKVNPSNARKRYERLSKAIAKGLVASCHDVSDGGLGCALAEVAFAGGHGLDVSLRGIGANDPAVALFSESQSRFVVTIQQSDADAFEKTMKGAKVFRIGKVIPEPSLCVALPGDEHLLAPLDELKKAWQSTLDW